MKVLHLISGGDTGGAKTHVLNLLKELKNKIDVRLVCFMNAEFSEEAKRLNIPISVIDTPNPITGLKRLKRLVEGEKIDVIHCHGARGNLMGILLRRHIHAPVVTTVHSDYLLDYMNRPSARIFYGGTNFVCLKRMDYYIGVSQQMRDMLIERNFPADRIYSIVNCIDFNIDDKILSKEEFFKSVGLNYSEGDVVAGIGARLNPVKDHPTLLKALAMAAEKAPRLKLILAGDGEDLEALKSLAIELKIEDRVCFAGWVNDMNSFFNAIDINLLTSISETFPYSLLEGAGMRCATVSTNVGGIPTLIDDRENGFLFTPGDVKALSDRLIELANDEPLRKRLGNALYEKVRREYSLEKMTQLQIGVYESIIKREKRKKLHPKRDGIIVCGAYGYGNAGDEAILEAIVSSVREEDELMPITILAKNPLSVKKKFRVNSFQTLNVFKMALAMKKTLLYINGGGTLIQNSTSNRSLYFYLFTLKLARLLGNRVDMYGCGIGPVKGSFKIKMVKNVLNSSVDAITLREPASERELISYGVKKPEITLSCDPALSLYGASEEKTRHFFEKHGLSRSERYLCFALRTWYGFEEKSSDIAAAAEYAYEKYGLTPLFISMNYLTDGRAAAQVTEHLSCPYKNIVEDFEPSLLISVFSKMEAVVSMRLHGLILSAVSGVPIVGLSYDPKIEAFLNYLGSGAFVELDAISAPGLETLLDEALKRGGVQANVKQNAERLKTLEEKNMASVRKLLSSR